ncbi:myb-binding protein 1A [Gracilinanus agilis]|uniref:myb-binding protein 1A n=1 Tax=Gracilinanus agilis TaxID=191870 RepID=UPI001CFDE53A|nr:myb-binding protein 1A [Gracilinanus agilis]
MTAMFVDLFTRHPMLCQRLVPVVLPFVTDGVRPYQQAQACLMLLKALQLRELKLALGAPGWQELIRDSVQRVTESLQVSNQGVNKSTNLKMFKALELLVFLIRTVKEEKLPVGLEAPLAVLQELRQRGVLRDRGRLSDITWQALKLLGIQRPKEDKARPPKNKEDAAAPEGPGSRKRKKGFLPETKKRKKRHQEEGAAEAPTAEGGLGGKKKRRRRRRRPKQHQALPGPGVNESPQSPSGPPGPDTSPEEAPASRGPKGKHRAGKRKDSPDATPAAAPLVKKAKLPTTGGKGGPKTGPRKKPKPGADGSGATLAF